jgi:hypothetical protein
MRTRGASLRRRSDSSHEARDAVGAIRDAERGEGDAHGETEEPTATSTESSEVRPGGGRYTLKAAKEGGSGNLRSEQPEAVEGR